MYDRIQFKNLLSSGFIPNYQAMKITYELSIPTLIEVIDTMIDEIYEDVGNWKYESYKRMANDMRNNSYDECVIERLLDAVSIYKYELCPKYIAISDYPMLFAHVLDECSVISYDANNFSLIVELKKYVKRTSTEAKILKALRDDTYDFYTMNKWGDEYGKK